MIKKIDSVFSLLYNSNIRRKDNRSRRSKEKEPIMAKTGLKATHAYSTTNVSIMKKLSKVQHSSQKATAYGASLNLTCDRPNSRKSVTVIINGVTVKKFI